MTLKCPHCGTKIRVNWLRCPSCSKPVAGESAGSARDVSSGASGRNVRAVWLWSSAATVVLVAAGAAWATRAPAGAEVATVSSRDVAEVRPATPRPMATPAAADAWSAVEADRSGTAAYRSGDVPGALERFEEAARTNPGDVTARANLAQVLVRVGRAADALPHLDYVVDQKPGEWSARFNRGRAYAQLERWTEARADYEAAAAIFPDDHVTLFNLGLVHRKSGDHAGAAAAFERVVALAPEDPSHLVALGNEYIALKRYDDMKRVFEQYVQAAPGGPDVENVKKALSTVGAPATR